MPVRFYHRKCTERERFVSIEIICMEYSLGANQAFLICPNQINLYTADETDPWKYVWIEFDGMRAENSLLQAGLDQDRPVYNPRTAEEGERLRDQMLYFSEHAARCTWWGGCPCFWTT